MRKFANRIASNMFWTLLSDGLLRIFIVLAAIYLARKLSLENFGYFVMGQAIGQYGGIFMDFAGNSTYAIREIAQNKQRSSSIIRDIVSMRIGFAILVILIVQIIILFSSTNIILKSVLTLSSFYPLAWAAFPDWAFRGLESMKYYALGNLVMILSFWSGILFFVKSKDDVNTALISWVLSYFLGGATLLLILRLKFGLHRVLHLPSRAYFGRLRSSLHFSMAGLLTISVPQGLLLLTGIIAGAEAAGMFGAVFKIILAIGTAGSLIAIAVYPILSSIKAQRQRFKQIHSEFSKMMLLISLPIAAIGIIWADKILLLILGPKYINTLTTFKILLWTIPLSFLIYATEMTILAEGKEFYRLIAILISVLVMLFFALLLISRYHEVGSAQAYLYSICSLLLLFSIGLYGIGFPSRKFYANGIKSVLLVCTCLALLLLFRTLKLELLGIIITAGIYMGGVFLLRLVDISALFGSDKPLGQEIDVSSHYV